MKKILVLCTGNSCRSIIAEAQINAFLDGYTAQSCGAEPTLTINPYAKKVLKKHGIWQECYYSKSFEMLQDRNFDLVVTVCDSAKERCPVPPDAAAQLHVGFEDPDGGLYEQFEQTYNEIKNRLLKAIVCYDKE